MSEKEGRIRRDRLRSKEDDEVMEEVGKKRRIRRKQPWEVKDKKQMEGKGGGLEIR